MLLCPCAWEPVWDLIISEYFIILGPGVAVAKYKKKKPTTDTVSAEKATTGKSTANKLQGHAKSAATPAEPSAAVSSAEKKPKRIASGSLKLQFAGDLILVKNSQKALGGLFKRYAALFETLANMPKEQRGLVYKVMTGLMLTSHAKKATTTDAKRNLFELKNQLFLAVANDRALRRQVEFKYLVSKNFRVLNYCETCKKMNAEMALDRHKWKYCKQCNVDHNFYNLLSMEIRFPQGFARMFISNDQISKLEHFKLPRRINADLLKEEAIIDQFHYNTRNLDAIDLDSIMALHGKLLQPPPESTEAKRARKPATVNPG